MPSKCEDCALKVPRFGLPAEGTKRCSWCGGCARGHGGAQDLTRRRCEDCALTVPNFGLPAEGKVRWCGGCARSHDGAISRAHMFAVFEARLAELFGGGGLVEPARDDEGRMGRPLKRERGAECQRSASRAPPRALPGWVIGGVIDPGALRDDGTAIGSERALAPARPAPTPAPAPAPPRHDDDAHSLEADGLQVLIVVPGSLC